MSNLRANPCLRAIDAVLCEHGIAYTIEYPGKHPKVVFPTPDGGIRKVGFSLTPSDHRAPLKAATQIRRILRSTSPPNAETSMSIHQTIRSNVVYQAVKAELDEAGIPFTLETGKKHHALRFDLNGQPRRFALPHNPYEGRGIENYRHQMRRLLKEGQDTPESSEGEDALAIVRPPTLGPGDLVLIEGDIRVQDLVLAEKLGFGRPSSIRVLIESRQAELESLGPLHREVAKSTGGRPGRAYWLTGDQAVRLSMFARTDRAEAMRGVIQAAFKAHLQMQQMQAAPALPAPETARDLVPVPTPSVPELLANEEAITAIVARLGSVLVQHRASGSVEPLDLSPVTALLGQISREIALMRTMQDAFQRDLRDLDTRLLQQTAAIPASPWSRPILVEGRHDFEAANPREEPVAAADPDEAIAVAPVSLQKDDETGSLWEVYAWHGLPRGSFPGRMNLSARLRRSLEKAFPKALYPLQMRKGPDWNMTRVFPKAELEAWYLHTGKRLIEDFLRSPL